MLSNDTSSTIFWFFVYSTWDLTSDSSAIGKHSKNYANRLAKFIYIYISSPDDSPKSGRKYLGYIPLWKIRQSIPAEYGNMNGSTGKYVDRKSLFCINEEMLPIYIYIYIYMGVGINKYIHVYINVCVNIFLYISIYMYAGIYMYLIYTYMSIFISISNYAYIYIYVCVCVCNMHVYIRIYKYL